MNVRIGFVFTPTMARDLGIQLVSERVNYNIHLRLYRELDARTGDIYIVTTSNVVTTLTSLERVAQYALLHS